MGDWQKGEQGHWEGHDFSRAGSGI